MKILSTRNLKENVAKPELRFWSHEKTIPRERGPKQGGPGEGEDRNG